MRDSLLATTAVTCLTLALAGAPSLAHAGTAHTLNVNGVATTAGQDFSGNMLGIPTFDTTKGSLQSVLIVESLSASYKGAFFQSASAPQLSSSAALGVVTNLSITGGPSVLDGTGVLSIGNSGPITLTPGGSAPFNYNTATTSKGPFAAATLSPWETVGPGSTWIQLSSITGLNPIFSGGSVNANPTLSFKVAVSYAYTTAGGSAPVPEPSSALMMGAGLLALGSMRWRKRR